jgi:hypothetical protein
MVACGLLQASYKMAVLALYSSLQGDAAKQLFRMVNRGTARYICDSAKEILLCRFHRHPLSSRWGTPTFGT